MPAKTVNVENAFIIARSGGEIKGYPYLQTAAFHCKSAFLILQLYVL